jgi:hypothetical protein
MRVPVVSGRIRAEPAGTVEVPSDAGTTRHLSTNARS